MSDVLSQAEMRDKLRQYVAQFTSQARAAEELEITPPYLNDLLQGKRNISSAIAEKLGFTKKTVYEGANPCP